MNLEIDQKQVEKAGLRIQQLTGVSKQESEGLLKAFLEASAERVLLRLTENAIGPTTLAATRTEDLYFVCKSAGRILSEREVEVIYRLTPAAARSLLANMRAAYEGDLLVQLGKRMQADARVERSGTEEKGLTFTVFFADLSSMRTAMTLLTRAGLGQYVDESPGRRSITFPRNVKIGEKSVKPLDILNLPTPG